MSGLAVLLTAWRGARPRGLTQAARGASVRLLPAPARAAETETERLLAETLAARGAVSPRVLVSLVACALYRRELAHGGGLADLGLFGENLFVPDVTRALDAARGVLWEIEIAADPHAPPGFDLDSNPTMEETRHANRE